MHVRFGPGATGKGPANGGHLASGLPVPRQTPHEEICLQLSRDAHGIVIAVWDADYDRPRATPMTELTLEDLDLSEEAFDDNGGWGLHIVKALSAKCGVTGDPAGGKWIWSRLHP